MDIKYDVLTLDVWGHSHDACADLGCSCAGTDDCDCEGFTVNDRSYAGSITLSPDADDLTLLRALQAGRYLTESVGLSELTIGWNGEDSATVDIASDGMPLFQIERSYR
jgi:hypothetical protein